MINDSIVNDPIAKSTVKSERLAILSATSFSRILAVAIALVMGGAVGQGGLTSLTTKPALAANAPSVIDAKVRLPAVDGRPAAGFFLIKNSNKADKLLAISTPAAQKVELHNMIMSDGVMKMTPMSEVPLPANGKVGFVPGGKHAMLFGLKPGLKSGDKIPLIFSFASGAKVTTNANIVTVRDMVHQRQEQKQKHKSEHNDH